VKQILFWLVLALVSHSASAQNGRYRNGWMQSFGLFNSYNYGYGSNFGTTQWYSQNEISELNNNGFNNVVGLNNFYGFQGGDIKTNLKLFGINLLRNELPQLINVLVSSRYRDYDRNIEYLDNGYNVTFFDELNSPHVEYFQFE